MIDLLVRVTLVLFASVAALLAARGASSALRHWICFLALAACLAMPLLMRGLPAWELALLPAAETKAEVAGGASLAMSPTTLLLFAVWLGGMALLGLRLARGIRAAHRLCRRANRVRRGAWTTLASQVRRDLGVGPRVRLLVQDEVEVPFAWGYLAPVVVLPASAARWSRGQFRAVLIHEMAHIRRRDCWTRLVVELACVVFWFHPLVWLLARQMRHEQEAACDDCVLARGARPSGFAALLLETVRGLRPRGLAAVAAFGFRSGLERRIRSLLQTGRSRQAVTADHHFWLFAAALALVLPIAAAQPVSADQNAATKNAAMLSPVAAEVSPDPPAPAAPPAAATRPRNAGLAVTASGDVNLFRVRERGWCVVIRAEFSVEFRPRASAEQPPAVSAAAR